MIVAVRHWRDTLLSAITADGYVAKSRIACMSSNGSIRIAELVSELGITSTRGVQEGLDIVRRRTADPDQTV